MAFPLKSIVFPGAGQAAGRGEGVPTRSESEHGNPESERAKPESEPVSSERTETAAAKRKLERSQSKTSLRDRLVALAEQRKRESPGGLDR